ncbi:MAG TPA: glycosyltransferase family 39 protein, partial [Planctomycetota bacterium]|nr:glycosyltransferase family 39 protein [Planctomycetota bacterium]
MPQTSADSAPAPTAADTRASPWGERVVLSALVGITLLGGFLRAWRMDDFWLSADEATYYYSTLGDWESAQERIRVNAHPPLYYWILFGVAQWNGEIQVLRWVSLVAGVLCIPATYLLTRSFAGRTAGICAAFLVALSPGGQFLSQVMRPYTVQLLFLVLALAGLARYLTTSRTRWLVVCSAGCLLATLVHYSTLIMLAGVATCLLGLLLLRRLDARQVRRLFLAGLPTLIGAGWLYFTHISPTLMGGEVQANARATWLSRGYL